MVDIIIIVILLIAGIIGYFKGFLKVLYSLVSFILASIGAFFLRGTVTDLIFSKINFGELPEFVVNLIQDKIAPFFVAGLIYLVIYLIIRLIFWILIKTEVLPKEKTLRPVGALISFTIGLFLLTFLAYPISLTQIASDFEGYEKFNIYSKSHLTEFLLKLNPPVRKLTDNTISAYKDAMKVVEGFTSLGEDGEFGAEEIEALTNLVKNDIITTDVIAGFTKEIFDRIKEEAGEIDLTQIPKDMFEEVFKEGDFYIPLKELYDEGVLTKELIEQIIEENSIKGLTPEEVINMFN